MEASEVRLTESFKMCQLKSENVQTGEMEEAYSQRQKVALSQLRKTVNVKNFELEL